MFLTQNKQFSTDVYFNCKKKKHTINESSKPQNIANFFVNEIIKQIELESNKKKQLPDLG
ncbi:hypothetical protein COJ28_17880 [Bacillus thuringiensis]|nr:hypothetical protein COJ28_17880 [Bacillus thuringiensis]PGU47386.1 hypothetical protein COD63_00485 [Bacillus thuringiensis]